MTSKKQPKTEPKTERRLQKTIARYDNTGEMEQPLNLGIKEFKRANRNMRGALIRGFKQKAWDRLTITKHDIYSTGRPHKLGRS